jgi:hypothetical protein
MVVAAVLAAAGVVGAVSACGAGDWLYTKYNIHTQYEVDRKGERSYQASYSGWIDPLQGHAVVPPNTKVRFDFDGGRHWKKGFLLVVENPAAAGLVVDKIFFELNTKNMGMSVEEYVKLITSPTPVSLDDLGEKDRAGVKEGRVHPGMTKRGVMTALGYPAAHKTPNPAASNAWTYWRDRIDKVVVVFGKDGTVVDLKD